MKYEARLFINAKKKLIVPFLNFSFHPVYIIFGKIEELVKFTKDNKDFILNYQLETFYHNKLISKPSLAIIAFSSAYSSANKSSFSSL